MSVQAESITLSDLRVGVGLDVHSPADFDAAAILTGNALSEWLRSTTPGVENQYRFLPAEETMYPVKSPATIEGRLGQFVNQQSDLSVTFLAPTVPPNIRFVRGYNINLLSAVNNSPSVATVETRIFLERDGHAIKPRREIGTVVLYKGFGDYASSLGTKTQDRMRRTSRNRPGRGVTIS